MLKRLEGRTAVLVDGHDLTVEDNAFRFQPPARGFHLWIREWLFVARTDPHVPVVLRHQRPVAIELDLVDPLRPFRESVDDLRGHKWNKARRRGTTPRHATILDHRPAARNPRHPSCTSKIGGLPDGDAQRRQARAHQHRHPTNGTFAVEPAGSSVKAMTWDGRWRRTGRGRQGRRAAKVRTIEETAKSRRATDR